MRAAGELRYDEPLEEHPEAFRVLRMAMLTWGRACAESVAIAFLAKS